jgi:hypothetical protein
MMASTCSSEIVRGAPTRGFSTRWSRKSYFFSLFAFAHRFFCASEMLFRAAADIFRLRPRLTGMFLAVAALRRRTAGPNDAIIARPSPATDLIAALS